MSRRRFQTPSEDQCIGWDHDEGARHGNFERRELVGVGPRAPVAAELDQGQLETSRRILTDELERPARQSPILIELVEHSNIGIGEETHLAGACRFWIQSVIKACAEPDRCGDEATKCLRVANPPRTHDERQSDHNSSEPRNALVSKIRSREAAEAASQQTSTSGRKSANDGRVRIAAPPAAPAAMAIRARRVDVSRSGSSDFRQSMARPQRVASMSGMNRASESSSSEMAT